MVPLQVFLPERVNTLRLVQSNQNGKFEARRIGNVQGKKREIEMPKPPFGGWIHSHFGADL